MKKLTFIDHPKFVPLEEYDKAISGMIEKLKKIPEVISIYQLGSVSDPGISDIDMLAVFNDKATCFQDPRKEITKIEKYLFTHNLFGLPLSHFTESQKYTFFHGFNLLYGKDLKIEKSNISNEEIDILKRQIALEYLIKMYQTLSIQITYRVVKLRSILLEVKALLFDLKFLNVNKGKLFDLVNECIDMRAQWFSKSYTKKNLQSWSIVFHKELELFLKEKLITEKMEFYFEIANKYSSSRNVAFFNKNSFGFDHSGFTLPGKPAQILGKRYYNLNNNFNRFNFFLPISNINKHKILREKLDFERKSIECNRMNLPFFSPLRSSLNISEIN